MTRKVTLHDGLNHAITVSLDAVGNSVKIGQRDGTIVLPSDRWTDLFNAIRFVTGHKTK